MVQIFARDKNKKHRKHISHRYKKNMGQIFFIGKYKK